MNHSTNFNILAPHSAEAIDQDMDYHKKYPYLSKERIQMLKDIGAREKQWEASNNNSKSSIDNTLLKRQTKEFKDEAEKHGMPDDLCVMVIGATGAGKSATANTLLGRKKFNEGSSATTLTTEFSSHLIGVNGKQLTVVDTPGSWQTQAKNVTLPHQTLYVLVINLASPRFGQQELDALRALKGMDGRRILPMGLCFPVLTHADRALQNVSLEEYLDGIKGDPLHELITKDLKGNAIAVNNSAEIGHEQRCQQAAILKGMAFAKAQSLKIGSVAHLMEWLMSQPILYVLFFGTVAIASYFFDVFSSLFGRQNHS